METKNNPKKRKIKKPNRTRPPRMMHKIVEKYIEKIRTFFKQPEHFKKLHELITCHTEKPVPNLVYYFLVIYKKGDVVRDDAGQLCSTYFEYSRAVRLFHKRDFDFIPKIKNDTHYLTVSNDSVEIREPFPRMHAYFWLISKGFDKHFWADIRNIESNYKTYYQNIKRQYTEQHYKNRMDQLEKRKNSMDVKEQIKRGRKRREVRPELLKTKTKKKALTLSKVYLPGKLENYNKIKM